MMGNFETICEITGYKQHLFHSYFHAALVLSLTEIPLCKPCNSEAKGDNPKDKFSIRSVFKELFLANKRNRLVNGCSLIHKQTCQGKKKKLKPSLLKMGALKILPIWA